MSPTGRNNSQNTVLERVSAILDCFSEQASELTLSTIARRTGLAKSTTSRLVASMVSLGFLEQHERQISLGLRCFELGEKVIRPRSLRRLTYAHMGELRRSTGQTTHLAVLEGRHVVYIQIMSSRRGPTLPSRVGGRVLAHATGVGKALLAHASVEVVEEYIAGGLPAVGPRTTVDPDHLRAELWRIRAQGYAIEEEESGPGIVCVAAPIRVVDGSPIAAMSISGWTGELDIEASARVLLAAVEALRQQATMLPRSGLTL